MVQGWGSIKSLLWTEWVGQAPERHTSLGLPCQCYWMFLIIRNTKYIWSRHGDKLVSDILCPFMKWTGWGTPRHTAGDILVSVIECLIIGNASYRKKHKYIQFNLGWRSEQFKRYKAFILSEGYGHAQARCWDFTISAWYWIGLIILSKKWIYIVFGWGSELFMRYLWL